MATRPAAGIEAEDVALVELCRAIAVRDEAGAARLLAADPNLAREVIRVGASRAVSVPYFLEPVGQYMYEADTALHIAAAAYHRDLAHALVSNGAQPRARNRRGAEPLHYAADGGPQSANWDPPAQRAVIEYLIDAGADPDATDRSGVTALHRAARTRCADAARVLLEHGADPVGTNGSGSTALHLAVQNAGRGNTGTPASLDQQREVILVLLEYGARPTDLNTKGKTVEQSATSDWVRDLLRTAP